MKMETDKQKAEVAIFISGKIHFKKGDNKRQGRTPHNDKGSHSLLG